MYSVMLVVGDMLADCHVLVSTCFDWILLKVLPLLWWILKFCKIRMARIWKLEAICISHWLFDMSVTVKYIWGVLCQKQVPRAGTSNYIPQILWDVITCPCPWYLLLAQHSTYETQTLSSLYLLISKQCWAITRYKAGYIIFQNVFGY